MKVEEKKILAEKEVTIKTATWTRDSHGLFDYESSHTVCRTLKATNSCMLIRTGNDIKLVPENDKSTYQGLNEVSHLLSLNVSKDEECKIVSCAKSSIYDDSHDKLWLSLRNSAETLEKHKARKLEIGDIIKLGRIKFKIKDLRIEGASNKKEEVNEEGPIDINAFEDEPKDEEEMCRVCYSAVSSADNPLLAPCKCTGSMKFIHFLCIKKCLEYQSASQTSSFLNSYYWKNFECDVCKTTYPFCIKHQSQKYYLIDVATPSCGSYLMLESLSKDKLASRIIHVLISSADKKIFKLGRGHEADLRIADISVSRLHAFINQTEDGWQIEDNMSKFGTLALIKKDITLIQNAQCMSQVGRTLIYCTLKAAKNTKEISDLPILHDEEICAGGTHNDEDGNTVDAPISAENQGQGEELTN